LLSFFLAGWNYKERKRKESKGKRRISLERERDFVEGRRRDGRMFWSLGLSQERNSKSASKLIERKNGQS
jgi:hypothetical protein